jgi:hypothetical protein
MGEGAQDEGQQGARAATGASLWRKLTWSGTRRRASIRGAGYNSPQSPRPLPGSLRLVHVLAALLPLLRLRCFASPCAGRACGRSLSRQRVCDPRTLLAPILTPSRASAKVTARACDRPPVLRMPERQHFLPARLLRSDFSLGPNARTMSGSIQRAVVGCRRCAPARTKDKRAPAARSDAADPRCSSAV